MLENLSPVTRRILGPMLVDAPLEMELQPAMPPVEAAAVPELRPEREVLVSPEFVALLRANLHAAAEHAALGHEGPSFRTCSRPACLDAAKLIPQLEEIGPGATDAELDAILDRVLAQKAGSPATPADRTRLARGGTSYAAVMAE